MKRDSQLHSMLEVTGAMEQNQAGKENKVGGGLQSKISWSWETSLRYLGQNLEAPNRRASRRLPGKVKARWGGKGLEEVA